MLQRNLSALLIVGLLFLSTGCATTFSKPPSPLNPVMAEFSVAPKAMVDTVRQVVSAAPISIPVESVDKGVLITGYQRFPGEWHILRRWQEQTRYRIAIIPDWDEPTSKCKLQVTEETQTRATDGQTWDNAPELDRQDRSRELLKQIQQRVQAK